MINPDSIKPNPVTKIYPNEVSMNVPHFIFMLLSTNSFLNILGILLITPFEDNYRSEQDEFADILKSYFSRIQKSIQSFELQISPTLTSENAIEVKSISVEKHSLLNVRKKSSKINNIIVPNRDSQVKNKEPINYELSEQNLNHIKLFAEKNEVFVSRFEKGTFKYAVLSLTTLKLCVFIFCSNCKLTEYIRYRYAINYY